jgi:Domain of unknown function (DUF4394)/Calx-beta domain
MVTAVLWAVMSRVLCVVFALALVSPAGAGASDIVYGTTATSLVRFNASTPQTIDATLPLQGLPGGVTLAGLDERPESESLYALGSDARLYRVGKTTGVAELIAAGSLTSTLTGAVAVDFNPSVNRLRVVTSDDLNLRQRPDTGAQVDGDGGTGGVQPDSAINPAGDIAGIAYDRNFLGTTLTTLWGIDAGSDSLIRIGSVDGTPSSPNTGVVTTIGALGRDVTLDADADISPGGVMYASLPSAGGGAPVLASINLTTGAATVIGPIGAPVTQIAVADPPRVMYVHGAGTLIEVPGDAAAAGATAVALQVPGGHTIIGLETRPATGELLALSDQGFVFRVNRVTGALTALGQPGATGPATIDAGFDVNPVTDRARITTVADQNVTLSAFTPPFSSTAGPALAYQVGDANQGQNPNVVATAFSGIAADGTTTGFGIDVGLNSLVKETTAGSGVLQTVRPGVDYSAGAAFDMPATGSAGYAVTRLAESGNAHLVWQDARTVNQTNHEHAVDLGELRVAGVGSANYNGVAIAPYGTASVPATATADEGAGVARVTVARTGGSRGAANVEYDVAAESATAGADVNVASGTVTFEDGEATATIDVPLGNDTAVEGPETFRVTIARPGGAVTLDSDDVTTRVTILSDDPAPPGPGPPGPGPTTTVTTVVQAPPAPDKTRPVGLAAIAAQRLGAVRSSGLRLRLLVSESLTARVVATVDQKTRKRFGLSSTTVTSATTARYAGPQARSLRLRLTAAAKRKLAKARSIKLTVVARLTDAAGNVATVRENITLRR